VSFASLLFNTVPRFGWHGHRNLGRRGREGVSELCQERDQFFRLQRVKEITLAWKLPGPGIAALRLSRRSGPVASGGSCGTSQPFVFLASGCHVLGVEHGPFGAEQIVVRRAVARLSGRAQCWAIWVRATATLHRERMLGAILPVLDERLTKRIFAFAFHGLYLCPPVRPKPKVKKVLICWMSTTFPSSSLQSFVSLQLRIVNTSGLWRIDP
jgi:hypothetical protein